MRRTAFVVTTALIAACSGKDAVTPAAVVQSASSAKVDCIDEFVQEFEEASDQPPPTNTEGLCFDKEPASGPPVFPTLSRKVTIEYRGGDYFAKTDARSWTIGEFDQARKCAPAILVRSQITLLVRKGEKSSTRLQDGKLERSSATGKNYGSAIALGQGPGVIDGPAPGLTTRTESTPYGVNCTHVESSADPKLASMCSVEMPRTCAATRVMLPISISAPSATGGTMIGKTTNLRIGNIVDPNTWVLP